MRRCSIGIVLKLILFTILLVGLDAGALVAAAQGRVADAKSQASGRQEGSAMADLKRRMYVSGHSLTNPRTIELLGRMAGDAGVDLVWNMQYLEGSSIRQRREGRLGTAERRPYNNGADRSGQPADVLAEFIPKWRWPGDRYIAGHGTARDPGRARLARYDWKFARSSR